jgi:hypothetical protein
LFLLQLVSQTGFLGYPANIGGQCLGVELSPGEIVEID